MPFALRTALALRALTVATRDPHPESENARDRWGSARVRLVGAGEGIRTLDVNLGKVALYH